MIELKRDGRTCTVKLDTSIGWNFNFQYTCSDDAYAAFLHNDIREGLWKLFEQVRKDAYNHGWSDKRKRNIKQTWFSGHSKLF